MLYEMLFKQKYNVQQVLDILKDGEKSLFEIRNALECSESTALNLIKKLFDDNKIKRRNIRGGKNPFWLYSIKDEAKI